MFGQTVWRIARLTLGATFLGLGVVGLFLPFLQGILFIIIGLTLLSRDSSRAKRLLTWVKTGVRRDDRKGNETSEGVEDV